MSVRLKSIQSRAARSLAALAVAATFGLAACGKSGDPPKASGPAGAPAGAPRALQFPVEVAPVVARTVEYTITAVGSVEAFEQVAVTARVGGVVETVRFREGEVVTPDQVLVEIEPERFRLAVAQAQATLTKSEAAAAEAQSGLERRQNVNAKNPDLVRQEDLEGWQTRLAVARAEAAQARAALDLAKLNQHDARVTTPVAGVIQTRTVQTGQYVQPGAMLASLQRREPLLLRFNVPERDATPLRPQMALRFTVGGRAYHATISHVAAGADERSRGVAVTATVDDPARGELRPGAFAEITIPVGTAGDSPVIPQTAVRPSERGFLAFIVVDNIAHERVLELGLRTADGLVQVKSGVVPGEELVIRGAEALRDGAAVNVSADAAPPKARPAAPAGT
jgi:multidrug efflux system membrane fusion protein